MIVLMYSHSHISEFIRSIISLLPAPDSIVNKPFDSMIDRLQVHTENSDGNKSAAEVEQELGFNWIFAVV